MPNKKPNNQFCFVQDARLWRSWPLRRRRGAPACQPHIFGIGWAAEGMTFFSFLMPQPSCTPGRAAMVTGRIANPAA